MTVQDAIHIVAEEAAWQRRAADDLRDSENDQYVVYADKHQRMAHALDKLLCVARAFERMGEE